MLVIGLTGGIGSGKTAASDRFAELGAPVIDTDQLARELVAPGQPALADIVAAFGAECIDEHGQLHRARLRQRVFADTAARQRLEYILHPRIRAQVRERLATLDAPYCLVVIPLLVETGMRDLVNRVLVVDVPEAVQIHRVMARDRVDAAQAQRILAAQASRAQRLALADDVLENSGALDTLRHQVTALHQQYLRLATAPLA